MDKRDLKLYVAIGVMAVGVVSLVVSVIVTVWLDKEEKVPIQDNVALFFAVGLMIPVLLLVCYVGNLARYDHEQCTHGNNMNRNVSTSDKRGTGVVDENNGHAGIVSEWDADVQQNGKLCCDKVIELRDGKRDVACNIYNISKVELSGERCEQK